MAEAVKNQQKNRTVPLLTGILILVIGLILIICNKSITGAGVVTLAGILFLLTGVINLVIFVTRKDHDGNRVNTGGAAFFGWFVSIAAIILGLCMLVFVDTFNSIIPFIFAILVFFGAVTLAYTFIFGLKRVIKIPGWLWIFPLAMIVLGIVIITRDSVKADSLIMILTGAAMEVFGLGCLFTGALVSGARRQSDADKKMITDATESVPHIGESSETDNQSK